MSITALRNVKITSVEGMHVPVGQVCVCIHTYYIYVCMWVLTKKNFKLQVSCERDTMKPRNSSES
jgi:hypothetical protein